MRLGSQTDDRLVNAQLVDAMLQRMYAHERGSHLRKVSATRRRSSLMAIAGDLRLTAPAELELSSGRPDEVLLEVCGGQLNSLRHGHLGFPIQSFSGLGNV